MNSVWALDRADAPAFPSLEGELDVEVVIVGGGVTGLATALNLCEAGARVAVVEARQLGSGSTGGSTGNLYSTLSKGLSSLAKKWDMETVQRVVACRHIALDSIEQKVRRFGIRCQFARRPLYMAVAEGSQANIDRVEEEHRVATAAGLKSQLLDDPNIVGLSLARALRIEDQAQFNPLQYCDGLAKEAVRKGVILFENSPVISIEPKPASISTAKGKVRADHIVLATHTPKGINVLQAEMEPYREHGIAAPMPGAEMLNPPGIYWIVDQARSIRSYSPEGMPSEGMQAEGKDYLVVVGGSYKTGKVEPDRDYWAELESYGSRYFAMDAPSHQWAAQQYQAADLLPYIGHSGHDNVYVATGYAADGLVWSEVAAQMITHEILGRSHRDAALFNPRRFTPTKSAKGWVEANTKVAKHLSTDHFTMEKWDDLSQLAPGEGRIVKVAGESYAAYRSPEGELSTLSPVCPHMKCVVHWNAGEKSWDCPCHGSRFDLSGAVLEGPALHALEPREPPGLR